MSRPGLPCFTEIIAGTALGWPLISVGSSHYASWLNRIEAQFRALRYFTLAGTDHPDHATQARLIRRLISCCARTAQR